MKYKKSDINDCIVKAKKIAGTEKKNQFIFSTAQGYLIADKKPPFNQTYIEVSCIGDVALFTVDLGNVNSVPIWIQKRIVL